jgi:hypothetical protein
MRLFQIILMRAAAGPRDCLKSFAKRLIDAGGNLIYAAVSNHY